MCACWVRACSLQACFALCWLTLLLQQLLRFALLCSAALQVAVQTRPGFAKGLSDGMPKLVQAEGVGT